MRNIRDVLRYRFEAHLSLNQISAALKISKGSVHSILQAFDQNGLTWPLPADLTDSKLEENLYGCTTHGNGRTESLDSDRINYELSRPHVTTELLWREYHDTSPEGMSRATFYRKARNVIQPEPNMKMVYKGGDLLYVDYSGDSLFHIDKNTGLITDVELFVACWGASSYVFADVSPSQRAIDFTKVHVEAFEFFGCVPHGIVPDNLKSGVRKSSRYEPEINPLYAAMSEHYKTVVLPARVREPKDKAPVESAVGFVQRYVLGRLRNHRFFSLQEIRVAVRELVVKLNNEPMQGYGGKSRLQRFEEIDKHLALPLPAERFIVADVKLDVTVAPNYHVRFDEHYYSVPHELARGKVDLYMVGDTLEIYADGVHICRHMKQPPNYQYTTRDEHMPANHRFVRGWSAEWFINRAGQIGIATAEVANLIMKKNRHPQQGFNSVMGLLNLTKSYSPERIEDASRRAIHYHCATYRSVKNILEQNLDKEITNLPSTTSAIIEHENLRGADYFTNNKQVNE